ncbi:hypothetical protein D3C83_280790 [compost metagenome]
MASTKMPKRNLIACSFMVYPHGSLRSRFRRLGQFLQPLACFTFDKLLDARIGALLQLSRGAVK